MTLTNAEIVSRLKLLSYKHLKANSGTSTSLVNTSLIDEINITNYFICFISGPNEGIDKIITAFFSETGTIQFEALDNVVDNLTEFCILEKGFQSDISQAENAIRNDLRNKGYDLDLFLNSNLQLKELHIFKTISIICGSLMNDGTDEDVYYINYNRFNSMYNEELSRLIADYDLDESGSITDDEEFISIGQAGFTR